MWSWVSSVVLEQWIQKGRKQWEEHTGREMQEQVPETVPDEICTGLVDHVLVHGMSMREAGQRV